MLLGQNGYYPLVLCLHFFLITQAKSQIPQDLVRKFVKNIIGSSHVSLFCLTKPRKCAKHIIQEKKKNNVDSFYGILVLDNTLNKQ